MTLSANYDLETSASAWLGTRYLKGQRCRGVGVDCVHFVAALFESRGIRLEVRRLPACLGAQSPARALAALRETLRSVPHRRVCLPDEPIEPWDVLVFGCADNEGIQHLGVAGESGCFWHATQPTGVQKSSLACYDGALLHVFRCLEPL